MLLSPVVSEIHLEKNENFSSQQSPLSAAITAILTHLIVAPHLPLLREERFLFLLSLACASLYYSAVFC